jgi:hypothetical protein
VVLYGCETWSLTVREEHKLRVFESRVLRRIFGAKRNEVMGVWRELHVMKRRMKLAGHKVRMGVKRNAYRLFVRKPEGKRPL